MQKYELIDTRTMTIIEKSANFFDLLAAMNQRINAGEKAENLNIKKTTN